MNAVELIDAIESNGGRFQVNGQQISITPRSAAELLGVREQLIEHKQEILTLLGLRSVLPPGVRLRRYAPRTPPVPLPDCCSMVTDVGKFTKVTLVQVAHCLTGRSWLDGGWPLSVLVQRLQAVGVEIVIDAPAKDAEVTYERVA